MIDEVPSAKLAVYLFLEMIALGFALEAVTAFMHGTEWWRWTGAIALGVVFMVLGVKSSTIIDRWSDWVDWKVWGHRITIAFRILFAASAMTIVGAGYYEWHAISGDRHKLRQSLGSTAGSTIAHDNPQPAPAPENIPAPVKKKHTLGVIRGAAPVVNGTGDQTSQARGTLDWRDKRNWRNNLHTGMSRSQVRALFGEPRNMSVSGNLEFWEYGEYGNGEIVFDISSEKDGSLFSWDEPR